jgi:tRNA (cmo5U34)-methyltransferase
MATEHRVATHLGLAASEYDAAIRRYIPAYEEMIETVVAIVAALDAPQVIDLGAGTGALGAAILDRAPRALVSFLDIDPAMLEVARARVAAHGGRAELRRGSFDDALPACDAAVASLALHHVPELARKRALYARIHAALRRGGVLLIADVTVHESGAARDLVYRAWASAMAEHGIAATEAQALFAKWAGEDRYYPLAVELSLLSEAGFAEPECFWKRGPSTVFGAFR